MQLTESSAAPLPPQERPAVLVIDDLPEKLLVMQTVLEGLDTDVVLARSGSEGLRELLGRDFAVVLLDVNMPDIDGFETAAMIRGYKRTAHTPIIFITAYVDEMQAAQSYSLGAVDYIVSPVVPDILRSKVRVFLDLYLAQRRMREQAEERLALVTAEAARRAAEASTRRLAFLAQVSRLLGGSLEQGTSVVPVLGLVQRELGGVAAVALIDAHPRDAHHRNGQHGAPQPASPEPHVTAVIDAAATPRVWVAGAAASSSAVQSLEALPHALGEVLAAALERPVRTDLDGDALARLGAGLKPPRLLAAAAALPLAAGARRHGVLFAAVEQRSDGWDALEDVAPRLAMALENARLYGSLEQEIEERRAVEQRLVDSNRRKDEFLAMLSHELRNPLAPIHNAAEVVRLSGQQNPRLEWASAVMSRQVEHMRRLIDELLDVARIGQGKVSLQMETLDLRAVVLQAVETVKPLFEARGHELALSLPEHGVWLRGDASRLTQVVGNLLANAAKYTDEAGDIRLSLVADDGQAVLRVRDDGIGIDSELLPRIFDLFEQGRRGLDRSQGGLGVGLTLAQRLVAMHQGSIEVNSAGIGQGAEFVVRLPGLTVASDLRLPEETEPVPDEPQGCRVLVVDDNRDAAESAAFMLNLAGHEVRIAADGPEALRIAAEHEPQVVVLDIGLPGMDGYEVAARLRELPATRDALLIAMTGYGSESDRQRSGQAGFDLHLVKPADPQEVNRAIAQRMSGCVKVEPPAIAGQGGPS